MNELRDKYEALDAAHDNLKKEHENLIRMLSELCSELEVECTDTGESASIFMKDIKGLPDWWDKNQETMHARACLIAKERWELTPMGDLVANDIVLFVKANILTHREGEAFKSGIHKSAGIIKNIG